MDVDRASPEQQEAIAELLKSTFGSGLSPSLLSRELLRWKFFSSRPDSTGSRSYVMCESEKIQAHACEWPISFRSPSGQISACHIIDWVALPEAKGTGVQIFQYLMEKNDAVLCIGGTEAARRLFPKLGFRPYGKLDRFARVVRPWRQYCSRPLRAGWRDIARLARNSVWSIRPRTSSKPEWTVTPVSNVHDFPENVSRFNTAKFCLGVRSASRLQYLLDCPVMKCGLFTLSKARTHQGFFLLNQAGGQCRIIDLAVNSEAPRDWAEAYRAALATALRNAATCEVTTVSSLPWLSDTLRRIGFRLRGQIPVMLYDRTRNLSGAPPLLLQMTDNDACFLYDEMYPFLT